jgi:CRISPR-associated protein Cas6
VTELAEFLDVAFPVSGGPIDRAYPYALARELTSALPWLAEEPLAGVHPIRGLTASGQQYVVGGRARLALRVPEARAQDFATLQGALLNLLSATLTVGSRTARPLLPHPVLFSHLVVTGDDDEGRFYAMAQQAVVEMGLTCGLIVGRRGSVRIGPSATDELGGFSLMLHGLSPEASLIAQAHGVGLHRRLGCGVFVPHKSIAAVGS